LAGETVPLGAQMPLSRKVITNAEPMSTICKFECKWYWKCRDTWTTGPLLKKRNFSLTVKTKFCFLAKEGGGSLFFFPDPNPSFIFLNFFHYLLFFSLLQLRTFFC
jgi:hypothetical protein